MRFVKLYNLSFDCICDMSGNRGEAFDASCWLDEFRLIAWVLVESLESLNYKGE